MLRQLSAAVLLLVLGSPLWAQSVGTDCAKLTAAFNRYDVPLAPARPEEDWCVLDGVTWRAGGEGWPDLTADQFRLRGTVEGPDLMGIEGDLAGLQAVFKAGDPAVDERWRSVFRLQTAELQFAATRDDAAGVVRLTGGLLRLSSGMEVTFSGRAEASGLSGPALLAGRVTAIDVGWRNDGRVLRPVMELLGEDLGAGARHGAAVDAARRALRDLVGNLPPAALAEDSAPELQHWVTALPQGRGRLRLSLVAPAGIGAEEVLVAGLAGDGFGPEALAELLQAARITATWTPGIAP